VTGFKQKQKTKSVINHEILRYMPISTGGILLYDISWTRASLYRRSCRIWSHSSDVCMQIAKTLTATN